MTASDGDPGVEDDRPRTSTTVRDLPDDVIDSIAYHLGLEGTWRAFDEVVRDQAALAMAGRAMRPFADRLALQIRRHLGIHERVDVVHVTRPVVPDRLQIDAGIGPRSSMNELREAAAKCGLARAARSREETWARIRDAIADNADLIERRTERRRAYDEGDRPDPVAVNPVPVGMRARAIDPQRLTAKGARERFVLTERDLEGVPALLRRNPHYSSASPMRLFLVRDLRRIAESKYGGIAFVADQRRAREARSERATRASAVARENRRETLERALAARGCELRADSRLCAAYLRTGQGDADSIARTMCEMKFCHERTRYREILDEIVEESRVWGCRYDIHDASRLARQMAIDEFVALGNDLHLVPMHLR